MIPTPLPMAATHAVAEATPSREAIALAVAIEIAAIAGEGTQGLAAKLRRHAGYDFAEDGPLTHTENRRIALLRAIADQLDALA